MKSLGTTRNNWMLVTLFKKESGETYRKLSEAVTSGAVEQIRIYAHKLAGATSTCGMHRLAERLHHFEQNVHESKAEETAIMFGEVSVEFERVENEITKMSFGSAAGTG